MSVLESSFDTGVWIHRAVIAGGRMGHTDVAMRVLDVIIEIVHQNAVRMRPPDNFISSVFAMLRHGGGVLDEDQSSGYSEPRMGGELTSTEPPGWKWKNK